MKTILMLLFLSDFWLGILHLKNVRYLKKELNEELIPVAWHPSKLRDWCVSDYDKKEIDPMLIEEFQKCDGSIQNGGIRTFLHLI